jgi:hypothetical protein
VSAREIAAVAAILTDPENRERTAEEVADLVIDQLDDLRARTHRLAVVGQIAFPQAPETTHTVVLGPFGARGILDSQEKFLKAVQGGSAARRAGQDLAWDTKTGRGRGRFMLAPAFQRPRAAWEFFRQPEPEIPARFAWIAESIRRWEAGGWKAGYGPVCHCGAQRPGRINRTSAGGLAPTGPCPVHDREGA